MHVRKKCIICDLDEIVVDALGTILAIYNREYTDTATKDDITDWNIGKTLKCGIEEINSIFCRPGFFLGLQPLPGAIMGLNKLIDMGHDVIIATSPVKNPQTCADKAFWVREYLPNIPEKNLIICKRKELLKCDVFIDDAPHHLQAHRELWPECKNATILYPYNIHLVQQGLVDFVGVDYRDTSVAWAQLVAALN